MSPEEFEKRIAETITDRALKNLQDALQKATLHFVALAVLVAESNGDDAFGEIVIEIPGVRNVVIQPTPKENQ